MIIQKIQLIGFSWIFVYAANFIIYLLNVYMKNKVNLHCFPIIGIVAEGIREGKFMIKKRQQNVFVIALMVFIFLMIFLTKFDLKISQLAINYNSILATIGQTVGEFPIYFILIVSGEIAMAYALRQSNSLFRNFLFLSGFGLSLWQLKQYVNEVSSYFAVALNNLQHGLPIGKASELNDASNSTGNTQNIIVWIIAYGILSLIIQWLLHRQTDQQLKRLMLIGVFASLAVWFSLETNLSLKSFWGRFRPYEIGENTNGFTNWYQINGVNGHKSFPSGHTMAATLAIVFSWFFQGKVRKTLWISGIIYGVLIGLSRLIIGAHFLSDITFSFFITSAIIYTLGELLNHYLKYQPHS